MVNVLVTFAQFERRLIAERTKEALAVKQAHGVPLGRPRTMPAELLKRIRDERGQGASYQAIAAALNAADVPTAQGGSRWYPSTVRAAVTGGQTA